MSEMNPLKVKQLIEGIAKAQDAIICAIAESGAVQKEKFIPAVDSYLLAAAGRSETPTLAELPARALLSLPRRIRDQRQRESMDQWMTDQLSRELS